MSNEPVLLEMRDITKKFPGVTALDGARLRIFPNEVMALLGENGAGKSTLMKVLSGVYPHETGSITMGGRELNPSSPRKAMDQGIAIIYQELNLIPGLSVGENIYLGREPVLKTGRLDWKTMMGESRRLLDRLGVKIDPKVSAAKLSIGDQQMVEIAKALSMNAQILIFDEPTDALTDQETENLFRVIKELKRSGKALVYISHRLSEVFQICDRVTVLRDGKFIGEEPVSALDEDSIIEMMVGRRLEDYIPYQKMEAGEPLLTVRGLESAVSRNINFSIRRGEVVGLAGLMGAGRTELALTLFGIHPPTGGSIILDGKEERIDSPARAISKGIAYISEDRKQLGLFPGMNLKDNMTLPVLRQYEKFGFRTDEGERNRVVDGYIKDLAIKTSSRQQMVGTLSGGNQQKVSIARGLITKPKVLIMDEPTRGVDVGAKKEIYKLINKFKAEGLGIIMISSEMPELLGISDRVMVMRNNTIEGELTREKATQESIMRLAIGIKER